MIFPGNLKKMMQRVFDIEKPFVDKILSPTHRVRIFKKDAPKHQFKWHSDEKKRTIWAMIENDWQFQFDNEFPFELEMDIPIVITKGRIHRLIPGTTELSLTIKETP